MPCPSRSNASLSLNRPSFRSAGAGTKILQGYLYTNALITLRVRKAGEQAFLTWKGRKVGRARLEFETEIPSSVADILLTLVGPARWIEKARYAVEHAGRSWDVDVFGGANDGLILAEIELKSPGETVILPPWIGSEVTSDPRFRNSKLTSCQLSGFCQRAGNLVHLWMPGMSHQQNAH